MRRMQRRSDPLEEGVVVDGAASAHESVRDFQEYSGFGIIGQYREI
jgi:hypothetical protein